MPPKTLIAHATELVRLVLRLEHPADAVVSRFFRQQRQLGQRERAVLAETAYGVLRHKRRFEHLAQDGPGGTGARTRRLTLLALAAPRAHWQDALNPNERDWLAHCDAIATADLPEACQHNLPDWLASTLQQTLGAEFNDLAAALLQPAPLDLRVNTWRSKRPQALQALQEADIRATPTPHSPWGLRVTGKPALQKLKVFTDGLVEVQDEGSQLLALLLDARRGEMVADFCAGAGGKTLALGAEMRNTGRLYAFDVSAHRLDALGPRLARSGLSNVHPVAIAHERDERIKRLRGKLDRVLVDAPCSGLGTLRRNPDLKWRQSPESVQELVLKQQAILASAASLLKPGGRLLYATCSLLQDENETVVQAFEQAHPDFEPLLAIDVLTQLKVPEAAPLCSSDGRFLRLWPHRHATDGFFAALWQRR